MAFKSIALKRDRTGDTPITVKFGRDMPEISKLHGIAKISREYPVSVTKESWIKCLHHDRIDTGEHVAQLVGHRQLIVRQRCQHVGECRPIDIKRRQAIPDAELQSTFHLSVDALAELRKSCGNSVAGHSGIYFVISVFYRQSGLVHSAGPGQRKPVRRSAVACSSRDQVYRISRLRRPA